MCRTMKAELEQKLADEKTNYSVLDGQLAVSTMAEGRAAGGCLP